MQGPRRPTARCLGEVLCVITPRLGPIGEIGGCRIETHGLSVAMAGSSTSGKPLAMWKAGTVSHPCMHGLREVGRDRENGLVSPRGDAHILTQRLKELAEDPGLLERLRGGIRPVKAIDTHGEELKSLYAVLVSRQTSDAIAVGG